MRTPIRKPGKYTFDKKDPLITVAKLEELKNLLERLKKARPALIAEVKRLALDGDFSENHAYSLAKGKLRGLNARILATENQIKKAIIIEKPNSGLVEIGSTIDLEVDGKQRTYTILGSSETSPKEGVISHNSPIGSALINKKLGDIISIKLPRGVVKYKILRIY
ncbi:transcription elongation factor GreA [Candidatus Parcubacteria bacterium]|nr:MAG: transcription elongation factor GreA [Candidatus Parcubacteria bacterium]